MARAPAPKPMHPADVRRAEVLASPAGYTATIRFNGRNNTLRAKTLEHAAGLAFGLEAAVARLGGSTRAGVYALPRDGGGPEIVDTVQWRSLLTPSQQANIAANVAANLKGPE